MFEWSCLQALIVPCSVLEPWILCRIAARPVHTGTKSCLQTLDAASCSQGGMSWSPCPSKWGGHVGRVWSEEGEPCSLPEEVLGGNPERTHTSHRPVPLDQHTPSLPQSRKSIHAFSFVTSYYFWMGDAEEFLTSMELNVSVPVPRVNISSTGRKSGLLRFLTHACIPALMCRTTSSNSPDSNISQSRSSPHVPATSHHLAFICCLSAIWDFLSPLFSVPPLLRWRATSHRPKGRLLPAPHDGAAAVPTSLLPWGKSFLPCFPLGSVFLTDNAKKSVCIPCWLQWLWVFSLCHRSCATLHFPSGLCLLISSPGWWSKQSLHAMQAALLLGGAHCWGASALESAGILPVPMTAFFPRHWVIPVLGLC